jgi:transposase-like protein
VEDAIKKILSGASLRETSMWLKQTTGISRSYMTIRKWVRQTPPAYEQFRKTQAELSAKYAARRQALETLKIMRVRERAARKRVKEEQRLKRLEERRQRGIADGLSPKGHKRPPPDVACPTCGSTHVTRHGFDYTKTEVLQSYHCKECFKQWTASETRFPHYKTPVEVVMYADTRYFMHPTLRQIQKEIEIVFHIKISRTAIMRWIRHEKEHRAQLTHRGQVFPGLKATIERLKNQAGQKAPTVSLTPHA